MFSQGSHHLPWLPVVQEPSAIAHPSHMRGSWRWRWSGPAECLALERCSDRPEGWGMLRVRCRLSCWEGYNNHIQPWLTSKHQSTLSRGNHFAKSGGRCLGESSQSQNYQRQWIINKLLSYEGAGPKIVSWKVVGYIPRGWLATHVSVPSY